MAAARKSFSPYKWFIVLKKSIYLNAGFLFFIFLRTCTFETVGFSNGFGNSFSNVLCMFSYFLFSKKALKLRREEAISFENMIVVTYS